MGVVSGSLGGLPGMNTCSAGQYGRDVRAGVFRLLRLCLSCNLQLVLGVANHTRSVSSDLGFIFN